MAILVAVQEKELFDKVVFSGVGVEVHPSGPLIVRFSSIIIIHIPFKFGFIVGIYDQTFGNCGSADWS